MKNPIFIRGLSHPMDDERLRETTTAFKPLFLSILEKNKISFAEACRQIDNGQMKSALKRLRYQPEPKLSKEQLMAIKKWYTETIKP